MANATQLETRMLGKIQALVNDTGAKVSYRKGEDPQVAGFLNRFKAPILSEIMEIAKPHLEYIIPQTKIKK